MTWETEFCPKCGDEIFVGMMGAHDWKDHNPEDDFPPEKEGNTKILQLNK